MRVPEAASRVAPRMRSDLCSAWQAWAMRFASRLPASQALRRFARSPQDASCGVARLMTRCRGPNERQPPASHYAVRPADTMARLTAALCLSCASAMSYHNPVKAPQRTGTSFLPVKLQSGNSKETNKNSSHARIAREARSATL